MILQVVVVVEKVRRKKVLAKREDDPGGDYHRAGILTQRPQGVRYDDSPGAFTELREFVRARGSHFFLR